MRKISTFKFNKIPLVIASLSLISSFGFSSFAAAEAVAPGATAPAVSTSSTSSTSTSTAGVSAIISKGNVEIQRRLTTLNHLASVLSSTTKLTAADKATLTTEVNNEITNLMGTKSSLDAATTTAAAQAAAQSVFTDYRVYALVVPQVYLVKVADDQQTVDAKLTTLASSISTRLGTSPSSADQASLTNLNNLIASAQKLSSSVETSVIALTPADYNTNHGLLVQYYSQLKEAQSDNQQAHDTARSIVNSIANPPSSKAK